MANGDRPSPTEQFPEIEEKFLVEGSNISRETARKNVQELRKMVAENLLNGDNLEAARDNAVFEFKKSRDPDPGEPNEFKPDFEPQGLAPETTGFGSLVTEEVSGLRESLGFEEFFEGSEERAGLFVNSIRTALTQGEKATDAVTGGEQKGRSLFDNLQRFYASQLVGASAEDADEFDRQVAEQKARTVTPEE